MKNKLLILSTMIVCFGLGFMVREFIAKKMHCDFMLQNTSKLAWQNNWPIKSNEFSLQFCLDSEIGGENYEKILRP